MLVVNAKTKYITVYGEYCTRITIRNYILRAFVAFTCIMLAVAINGDSEESIIIGAIPYLSLFIVLFINYHDHAVSRLIERQRKLSANNKEHDTLDWFSEELYGDLQERKLMGELTQLAVIPVSFGALLLIYSRWDHYSPQYRNLYLVVAIIGSICLVVTTIILCLKIHKTKQQIGKKH